MIRISHDQPKPIRIILPDEQARLRVLLVALRRALLLMAGAIEDYLNSTS